MARPYRDKPYMTDHPYPQRKSPRLPKYDYSQAGAYFVTICTFRRLPLFGEIRDGVMYRNSTGEIAAACWLALPDHYPHIELDVSVIMPNHMHGIIVIYAEEASGAPPLGQIINSYKGAVTRQVRRAANQPDLRIWQGRYHDHIIRSEASLQAIREYVVTNPARWPEDTFFIP